MSAPPPPPIPATFQSPSTFSPKLPEVSESNYFVIEKKDGATHFSFPDVQKPTGTTNSLSLKSVVRSFASTMGVKGVPAHHLYYALGRLRGLKHLIDDYNRKVGSEDPKFTKYIRVNTLQLLSGFGFSISKSTDTVEIDGLGELITAIEDLYKSEIEDAKMHIGQNEITFDGLQELYYPGAVVCGMTSFGSLTGFRVVQGYYQERRSLFGFEKSFHLSLEYVAAVGSDIAVIGFEEVLSGWVGTQIRSVFDLAYSPVSEDQLKSFTDRGKLYSKYVGGTGAVFLAYSSGSFFRHGALQKGSLSGSGTAQVNSPGRIMIDMARGSALGHYATQGADEASHAMIQFYGRYRRLSTEKKSSTQAPSDNLIVFSTLPDQLLPIAWPALVGFSFNSKSWGHVLISNLSEIKFNETAFEELVIDPNRKKLIKALVRFGGMVFDDIIAGKGGGSIFLLHGPPGVGKTLTAEAIAEVLHRPLYYVTMGELGTTPESVESRLQDILTLCSGWNALVLIDEADVFLEKRDSSDFTRNAMVCVMLRLLEYHPGILFLTTNRVTEFDPAFESRVTVALKYEKLSVDARIQVWRNLIARVPIKVGEINYEALGEHDMNGRQINNAVRLALALAEDAGEPITDQIIEQTIQITSIGRKEMKNAEKY
ncbi:hypothetical protein HK098_006246 [Nowakowskiella sp. JEL0407]|nr:hypothetical protein HK098_006246 [Nowakowskiella sp. JEL0407]